jgi:hypothetical protein
VINVKAKAMRKKAKKIEKINEFKPFQLPVRSMINWWRKDGSFNVELYLDICQAKI